MNADGELNFKICNQRVKGIDITVDISLIKQTIQMDNYTSSKSFRACFPAKPRIDKLSQVTSEKIASYTDISCSGSQHLEGRSQSSSQRSFQNTSYTTESQRAAYLQDSSQVCEIAALNRQHELVTTMRNITHQTAAQQRKLDSHLIFVSHTLQRLESQANIQVMLIQDILTQLATLRSSSPTNTAGKKRAMELTESFDDADGSTKSEGDEVISVTDFVRARQLRKHRHTIIQQKENCEDTTGLLATIDADADELDMENELFE